MLGRMAIILDDAAFPKQDAFSPNDVSLAVVPLDATT